MNIDSRVKLAQAGDKEALENLVLEIQDTVYNLALRMLFNPDDAREATQEILIQVITRLSTFQFKSKFQTWVYRVATNYLLNTRQRIAKDPQVSFEEFKADLESDLHDPGELRDAPEYDLMLNEIRIMCTLAMLLCLDQKHRIAYILGDIFELDHNEASESLSLSKSNYRKQLSRARAKVVAFTSASCGLVSDTAKCTCETKLSGAIRRGRVIPEQLTLAYNSNVSYQDVKHKISEMKHDLKTVSLQTSIPYLRCPDNFIEIVEKMMANI